MRQNPLSSSKLAVACCTALLILAGCGSNGGNKDGGGGSGGDSGSGNGAGGSGGGITLQDGGSPPVTIDNWCTAFADAWCEFEKTCQSLDTTNVAACKAQAMKDCDYQVKKAKAGTRAYSDTQAAACLNQLKAKECAAAFYDTGFFGWYPTTPPNCADDAVFAPAGTTGSKCEDSSDCDAGFCFGATGSCKTCSPAKTTGQSCYASADCVKGLSCIFPAGSAVGACQTPPPLAFPPTACGGSTGVSCSPDAGFCPSTIVFDGGTQTFYGANRVCTAYRNKGQACQFSSHCAGASFCNPDAGICETKHVAGESCSYTSPVIPCDSDAGFCPDKLTDGGFEYGVPNQVCLNYRAVGQSCLFNADCNALTGFCPSLQTDGGTFYGPQRNCYAFRNEFESCTSSTHCKGGMTCKSTDGGTQLSCITVVKKPDGAPCSSSVDCTSGVCSGSTSPAVPMTCGYKPSGEPCGKHSDCGNDGGMLCKGYRPATRDAGAVAGACGAYSADGQPCTNESVYHDSCANKAPNSTCLGGTCKLVPAFSIPAGGECDDFSQCVATHRCDFADPVTYQGTCVARLPVGSPCMGTPDCQDGLECQQDATSGDMMCTPFAAIGDSCDYNNCQSTLACVDDGSGAYVCAGVSAPGGTCSATVGTGPYCVASTCDGGTCVGLSAPGTPCSSSAQCLYGNCKNPDGGSGNKSCQPSCF